MTHARPSTFGRINAWFLILMFCAGMVRPPGLWAQENIVGALPRNVEGVLDTRISLDVQNAEIKGVLRSLAESFNLNIVAGDNIRGNVTITLKDVRVADALDLILEASGYMYQMRDNIIVVIAPESELMTEVIELNYVKPSTIRSTLQAFLSSKGSIEASDEEKRIVVKELPVNMKAFREKINQLDQPVPQILIEARMVEVEDSDWTAFGVQWNSNMNMQNMIKGTHVGKGPQGSRYFLEPGKAFGSDPAGLATSDSASFGLNLPETSTDLPAGQLSQGFTLGRVNSAVTIDALIKKSKASLLASPTISTLDGQEARIIIGEKYPFRENTLTAVGTTETTKFIDIGTALRVTPNVLRSGDIMLDIHPEVSSLNESLAAGPRINTREASTRVMVKNGQTVVIGGLLRNDQTVIHQKIPILGNLPFIGVAFKNKSTKYVVKELAVFITPYIQNPMVAVDETRPAEDALSPKIFYDRGVAMLDEFSVESLRKPESQRHNEAIGFLMTVVKNFPNSEYADASLYMLNRIYAEKLGDPVRAAAMWKQLRENYPDSIYLHRGYMKEEQNVSKQSRKKEKKQKKN